MGFFSGGGWAVAGSISCNCSADRLAGFLLASSSADRLAGEWLLVFTRLPAEIAWRAPFLRLPLLASLAGECFCDLLWFWWWAFFLGFLGFGLALSSLLARGGGFFLRLIFFRERAGVFLSMVRGDLFLRLNFFCERSLFEVFLRGLCANFFANFVWIGFFV